MLHRVVIAVAFSIVTFLPGRAQETNEVPIIWQLEAGDVANVRDGLEFEGTLEKGEGEEVRGAPLLLLVGIAVLPSLVDSLITYYRDVNEGGVIIDATGAELTIRNDPTLAYGTFVVRDTNGVEVKNFRSTPSQPDLSAAIAELAKTLAKGQ